MKNEEAIKWLKAISATQSESIHKSSLSERKEALHIAIQAIRENEELNEIKISKKNHKYIAYDGVERNGCPNCFEKYGKNEILYAGQKYCSVCGQAIDWSEE